jgi:acetyltransferase
MHTGWETLMAASSVAIIGASSTPGKPGHEVIRNIQENGFEGPIWLVNPRSGHIRGLAVQRSIADLPCGVDQAIIILPAKDTLEALRACADRDAQLCPCGGWLRRGG